MEKQNVFENFNLEMILTMMPIEILENFINETEKMFGTTDLKEIIEILKEQKQKEKIKSLFEKEK